MYRLIRVIIRIKWVVVLSVLLITLFLGYFIKDIKINSDVISSLPDDDPHASMLKQVGDQFGGNKMGMVILECDDVFTPEVIAHVRQVTDSIAMMDGISSVTSISNIINIKGGDEGLEIGQLIDEYNPPQTPEELARLREMALSKEMYRGAVVAADGTATTIIFTLTEDAVVKDVAENVQHTVLAMELPEKVYFAGSPMMVTSISDMIRGDLIRLIPIAFLLIAFILYLGFRSMRGVILPLLNSAIAIVWVMGIMALLGFEITMVTNNIPIILLAVGGAYTIHVLNRIDQEADPDKRTAIIDAMTYIALPVFLAALTTMIGFMSFIFGSYLTMIRDFGIFSSLGTFFTLILAIFFVPALSAIMPYRSVHHPKESSRVKRSLLAEFFLIPLQKLLLRHPKYILASWGVLLIVSIGGFFLIQRSVDIKGYFKQDNPARVAEEIMERKFGGSKPVFVLFKGDMQSPEVLNTMLRMEEYMKADDGVMTTQSVADLIVDLYDALGEGRKIPDEKETIEQLWFLLDGNEIMNRFVSPDLDEGLIISKFIPSENKAKKDFEVYMNNFIRENSSEDCTIEVTGMPFIDVTMNRSLMRSQMGSITIAVLLVILLVGFSLRSFKTGIFATAPIVASIIILFGVMGYTGITLNMATVLVASIALGIGVDYSIHVINHFNHSRTIGEDLPQALAKTIGISGKAIIINITSVSAGFLVLLFSKMVPLQYFGLLISLSMIGSGLGALTLLPVILILTTRRQQARKV
jgi:predicted RND superfamily exporter protein